MPVDRDYDEILEEFMRLRKPGPKPKRATCKHPNRVSSYKGACKTCAREIARANSPNKSSCHPENKYWGKNTCVPCYKKQYALNKSVMAICHPTRTHEAQGLCKGCYSSKIKQKSRLGLVGLVYEDLEKLYELQKGLCAICSRQLTSTKLRGTGKVYGNQHLDHDHKTGKARGLLCAGCNTAIGRFGDSVEGLQKAIEYLINPPVNRLIK